MGQLSSQLPWDLAQNKWAATLNPILALPILNGIQIDGINLVAGTPNAINHLLQRDPQGWLVLDTTASATIWRTAEFNKYTLSLEASANTTVSIWVF